jgi:hypothetical protein
MWKQETCRPLWWGSRRQRKNIKKRKNFSIKTDKEKRKRYLIDWKRKGRTNKKEKWYRKWGWTQIKCHMQKRQRDRRERAGSVECHWQK